MSLSQPGEIMLDERLVGDVDPVSSDLLEQIIDTTSAVIYVKDSLCRYILINRQFEMLFGLSREEIFGLTDFEVFPLDMALAFRENDLKVLSTEETLECKEIAPHADGPHTYMSVKFPLRDERGAVVALAGISTDITEQMKAQAELARVELEMNTANAVQMALYPKQAPNLPGIDIAGMTVPSLRTSGDYYDYVMQPDGSLVLAIGDVSGHGLGPALEMVETRASLRAILGFGCPLNIALERLNRILCEDLPNGMFVTLMAVQLDPARRTLSYAAAGHVGYLLNSLGESQRLNPTGLVLGVSEEARYEVVADIPLHQGDLLVLATDGIMEQMSPRRPDGHRSEMFGWPRTLDSIRRSMMFPAAQILANLTGDVIQWAGGESQNDDVTAIIVKMREEVHE